MRLSIRYNGYITDYMVNVDYAETQVQRAIKKIRRIVTTETSQKSLDVKEKKLQKVLKLLREVGEPLP